jgi:DNA repair protein RadC
MTVRELPAEMRPREEFLRRGAASVSDEVLVAIILRSGKRGRNVIDLARDLLRAAGGLGALSRASHEEILAHHIAGLGPVKAMELAAALELGRRAAGQQPASEPPSVRDPAGAARLIHPLTHALQQEVFWTLLLDTKNRLIGQPVEASRGLLDASPVHPREVFSKAIRHGAAAVILAHNHPSGDPTPSPEDLRVTRQLIEASRVLGIRVLDHIIVGRPSDSQPGFLSLRDKGLVSFDAV